MKTLVLLSGGIKSTTLLADCQKQGIELAAVTFDYGQRHKLEIECAIWQAVKYNIPHKVMDIRQAFDGIKNPLLGDGDIPEGSYLEQYEKNGGTTVSTYIPNRNMVLLSIASAQAINMGYDSVAIAVCENRAYLDTGNLYMERVSAALRSQGLRVYAPYTNWFYPDVVQKAIQLGVDITHTLSCYKNIGYKGCGRCAACITRKQAIEGRRA